MSNYGDQYMKCPECGGVAEAECVDVGVGLYIKDEYECSCGYNSSARQRMNVATYDDYFPAAANENVPGAKLVAGEEAISVRAS